MMKSKALAALVLLTLALTACSSPSGQSTPAAAGKPFNVRLKAAGYDAKTAAENIGAGYHTLAEAFSGWRDSPSHKANLLLKGATRLGIAAVYTPKSKYKVYWAMIIAEPDDRKD